ncbi:MAG: hypothetical protein ABSB33_00670 [Tepidisphaeraceae bacterium]|jgi:hypothetical protein
MGFRNVVNDGSSNQPRLRPQQSTAGMLALDPGEAGSIAAFLDRIEGAGFGGFEAHCQGEQDAGELAAMLLDRGLAVGYAAVAGEADDLLGALELAHRMRADYLSVRVTGSLKASPDIAETLEEMYELVNDAGLPLFIETRGGSVTQDLRRTVKVVKRFKKVRFTGDFSSYIAACELAAHWSEEVWDHFRQIARRCGSWHGALGIGDAGSGEMIQEIKKLWVFGIGEWLNKARPGEILPFCCDPAAGGWEQCLAIKRLAEEAWAEAMAERRPEENPVAAEPGAPAEIAANQGIH